uniref:Putative helicase A859L n=1 Tax=Lygus hesperus TaxID=30085 RepID=A0A0A9Y7X5_LYGHE
MNPYLYEAMQRVDKMLVFCRNIKHAQELYDKLTSAALPREVAPFRVYIAHSHLASGGVTSALASFVNDKRCVLFNVRLFQEGVEIPDLNAVFFAAPRYSSRDIIQSICRPLNKIPGKPSSFVFLPAVYDDTCSESHPINLNNFATLVPFTDALMDEDPSLFEYMIDP